MKPISSLLIFFALTFGIVVYAKSPAAVLAPSASFDRDRTVSLFTEPTFEGSVHDISAPLDFSITAPHLVTYIYKNVPIHNGRFSLKVGVPLPTGLYTAQLTSASTTLAQTFVRIGFRALPHTETVGLPPYDVVDGKLIRFFIDAEGDNPISIQSFLFTVSTTAANVLSGQLSVYSDALYTTPAASGPLNTEPAEILGGKLALMLDTPISIPQGHVYYFELDATVEPDDSEYGTDTILSDFVWSPNSFGTTSLDQDWYNAATTTLRNSLIVSGRTGTPAPMPPTCTMTATASTTTTQPVTVSWESSYSDYALWNDGAREVVQGSKTYSSVQTPKLLQLTFYGKDGTATCFVQFAAPAVLNQSSQNTAGAGTATTTATTTVPVVVDSLLASSTTGVVPFTAKFLATVNSNKSCAASTFSLGYGDLSTSTISVAKGKCAPVSTTFTHTYQKVGTYTAALYVSTGTSSAQLIQKQTITVKAKTAWFKDMWAVVAGVWASLMH